MTKKMPIYIFECMAIVQSRLLEINLQWKIHIKGHQTHLNLNRGIFVLQMNFAMQ